MPKGLYVEQPCHVTLRDYDDPPLRDDQYRIRVEFATIKHGTEFHVFSGQSPFQDRRFDGNLRLFVPGKEEAKAGEAHGHFAGNMVVGTVAEVGKAVQRFRPGERVYCHGPACETVTRREGEGELLRPPMTETDAVCLDPALYAYAAIRDARVCLGDKVVLFGLGAIGLMAVQMLRLNGCLRVIAVDPVEKRRRLAEALGAHLALDPTQCDVGWEVRQSLGCGADLAIEASGHYRALRDAIRSVRNCARIVTLGYYRGKDSELELGAEFFHNRLELIASMPVWDNPSREHPVWDYGRLWRAVVEFFQKRALTSRGILDPIVDFADSPAAYLEAYRDPSYAVKLGISFRT